MSLLRKTDVKKHMAPRSARKQSHAPLNPIGEKRVLPFPFRQPEPVEVVPHAVAVELPVRDEK